MRWFIMMLFCVALTTTLADPDPKKYKHDSQHKDKKSESLTDEERKFLRDVEEKYGITSELPTEIKKVNNGTKGDKPSKESATSQEKAPFPAVIAIEIVNDTDSNTKGKRTIDANLGYGYRTNNGYTYTYFGKSNQDKGKYTVYPYSQEDIPPKKSLHETKYSSHSPGKYSSHSASEVEIQPSQAYELVPVKNEQPTYEYNKPSVAFNTPSPTYSTKPAQTLYTTYNGHEFSGFSGQFPQSLMSNYFVDSSQLLQNPHYQNIGLTKDNLQSQNTYLNQHKRVVPVLVLRIPSSYLKNPTAELYADLPKNSPISHYLNNVNLQELVNQYFKKSGFSTAPQIMPYHSSPLSPTEEPQHYANPYVRPSYTQADYSGVQYSAVKPVMARYPLSYTQQKYLVSHPQSLYQHPVQQQQQYEYQYQYQYVPQTEVKTQSYYIQPQYQHSTHATSSGYHNEQNVIESQAGPDEIVSNLNYKTPQHSSSHEAKVTSVEYDTQNTNEAHVQPDVSQYISASPDNSDYGYSKDNVDYSKQFLSQDYSQGSIPTYTSQPEYYSSSKPAEQSSVSVHPSRLIHTEQYFENPASNPQEYVYQSQSSHEDSKSLVLSENYPSKDHTIATVLPVNTQQTARKPTPSIQTVSYVTPEPRSKYQSQFRIMVPQTVLKNPNSEKVSYVNSHSVPMHYTKASHYTDSESDDYSAQTHYIPPSASKPSYPRNYHSHPKRMVKTDSRPEGSSVKVTVRKQNERPEKKKSS